MLLIFVAGTIGTDATVRHLDSGSAAISFSVAHSEKWKDRAGDWQEKTTWVRCTIWRKSDNIGIAPYLRKGTKVTINGFPSASAYLKENNAVGTLEVNVREIDLQGSPQSQAQTSAPAQDQSQSQSTGFYNNSISDNDDLPF